MWVPGWEKMDQNECWLARFRKEFIVSEPVESCRIRISADSRYKLYVNGRLAEIGPSKGDRQVWFYDEVEIAPFLRTGENVIAAQVLRYPMLHSKGNHGIFRTEMPGLYVKEQQGKENMLGISGDPSWKCSMEKGFRIISESPYFAPLQILEERSGFAGDAGWKEPGYQDGDWADAFVYIEPAVSKAVSPGNLLERTIPYMRKEMRRFTGLVCIRRSEASEEEWERMLSGDGHVMLAPHSRTEVEINAGELNTGFLSLRMQMGAGSTVKVLTSEGHVRIEEEKGPMRLPRKGDRCDWENGQLHGFTDTYHVAGYGKDDQEETYEPFWFRTFRFIRLEITAGEEPLCLTGFDYLETGYPLEARTQVTTSDSSLEAVWDISLRTLKRCMHETYEDCPFYEQLQYAMDSRSQILYTYMVAADDRLARKCMDDFRRSQRYDGLLNCSYPCYGPNVIPGFSIYYILMLYDHMMYFGDREFLRQHMGTVDGILEYFRRNLDERGLAGRMGGINGKDRYWSFIDWTAQWDETSGMPRAGLSGPITMESLLYIMGLDHAAKVLDYLGRSQVAREYRSRADEVRKAVNIYCRDEAGMYTDGPGIREYSQHCQVFALLTDTVSVEKGRENLKRTLEAKADYAQCSVAMAHYLFRALQKAGLYEETDREWDLWRNMVKKNLTTCVEDGVNERSDCHAWGALALYELPAVVLGVHPEEPGYETIGIAPVEGCFTWAKGEAATKWGMVKVDWKKENGKFRLDYQAPEGVKVRVCPS